MPPHDDAVLARITPGAERAPRDGRRPGAVLVTGGAGFIGSSLIRHLLRTRPDWRVVNYDALTYAGTRASLRDVERAFPERYRFVLGDVRDGAALARVLAEEACTHVIHLAAESHVDRSIADGAPFMATNVEGTQVLLDACARAGRGGGACPIERIVHVSTDEVYGSLDLDDRTTRFTEESPLRPTSPYAASKAASDLVALAHHRTFGTPVVVTRCSNNFGPYQYPEKVIPLFVTNVIDGMPVPLYGDGRNVRDWLHVEDHCAAILKALDHGAPGRVYNVGADNERSNLELTRAIIAATLERDADDDAADSADDADAANDADPTAAHTNAAAIDAHTIDAAIDALITHVPDRLAHDRRYAVDATRIRSELGWRPTRTTWPHALRETVRWYRRNEWWWRPLKEPTKATRAAA